MPNRVDKLNPFQSWLLLSLIPNASPVRMKALCGQGWDEQRADQAMREAAEDDLRLARRDLPRLRDWLNQPGCRALAVYDPDYPPLLRTIPDPPPVLYIRGHQNALSTPQMAIVGTRKPSADGRRLARDFGAALVRAGYAVTSGMALGIDTESHAGALAEQGITMAVLGSGLDQLYPRANQALAERILERGALVSEFPPWAPPAEWHFPVRNRVISGLSHGTLVVEAAQRSGSLITARLAAEQGREVFAIPGSVFNSQSRGCHALLRAGAKLVETIDDILEELPALQAWERARLEPRAQQAHSERSSRDDRRDAPEAEPIRSKHSPSSNDRLFLEAIGFGEASADQIAVTLGEPLDAVLVRLSELELRGLIVASPAGFSRAD